METNVPLVVYDGQTLAGMHLPPTQFCVEGLLPHGLSILGGPSKYGKSWIVLDLCVHVAKGEPLWNLPVHQGDALYLALEDGIARVRERLLTVTEEVPPGLYFAVRASTIAEGLCDQIREQVALHPSISLVVVDTFQIVRGNKNTDVSYAGDYEDVRALKQLADELNIALLLVHHLRKRGDNDPVNKLTGSTGISGAADAIFVFDKSDRMQNSATLICTGRDIEARQLTLTFEKENCTWQVTEDSLEQPTSLMPDELQALIDYMRERGSYSGGNQELANLLGTRIGKTIHPKGLKQMMNKWRYSLSEVGVTFWDHQSSNRRLVDISYAPSDDS